ncbi:MAG TPA: cytochrome P450 [Acidimicrobiales bacterium]|nr:cytochrome P450 [Acidimicrobiales bacterium]
MTDRTAGGIGEFADLLSPSRRSDPYPGYARLRDAAPIWEAAPGFLVLSRHEDCGRVLRDLRFGHLEADDAPAPSRRRALTGDADREAVRSFLVRNPPDHTRLRRLVSRSFTPRRVEELAPRIEALTAELLSNVAGSPSFDVVSAIASPLPVAVICELFGVRDPDRHRVVGWSHALARGLDPAFLLTADERRSQLAARDEFADYLVAEIARRRRLPGDDLISDLVATHDQGESLTDADLVATCILLLIAGHETTTSLVANAVHAFLRHPAQWEEVAADPELVPGAVEEVLRFDSPVQLTMRVARADADVGGIPAPRGTFVVLLIGAANRDPLAYDEPDRFDVRRQPRPHLAFGQGVHFCLGAPLARLEAQIVLRAILTGIARPRLVGDPTWKENAVLRGLQRLEIEVGM